MDQLDDKGGTSAADQALHWFMRLQACPLDEVSQAEFKAWLVASPEHRRQFNKLDIIWHCAPTLEEIEADRAAPERQVFAWNRSDAWRSAVCPVMQRLANLRGVTDMVNFSASASPVFLL